MRHTVKILLTELINHNVKRFIVEKPVNYRFTPGQATDVWINQKEFSRENRPFTFTSLNDDLVLEFTIKSYPTALYPQHTGVTEKLHQLKPGDELLIGDPWGTINYQGRGVFIAGGAGLTPFLAIFKQLKQEGKLEGNSLIFSNKRRRDIFLENELQTMFGLDNLITTLTQEKIPGYENGRVDIDFLRGKIKNFDQNFYVCGPKPMVFDLRKQLGKLGVKSSGLVFEQ